MKPDSTELGAVIDRLNGAIVHGCAGGIAIDEITEEGEVRISLQGMCGGCSCRALTIGVTLRPAIEAVKGVTRLTVSNSGMSRYAEERIAKAFAGRSVRIARRS